MTRILIVDDNRALAENLAEILVDQGFDTSVFDDPRQAQAAVHAGEFQLALLDMRMPHMDGVELFRRIHAVDPALPAVAMTAFAKDEGVWAAMDAGLHAVLSKPVPPEQLMGLLSTILKGPTCLVVDDDRAFAANLVEILLQQGINARAARSVEEAQRILAQHPTSRMVVDMRLPDGDGLTFLRALCVQQPHCHCILVSAVEPTGETTASLRQQGITFIPKPLTVAALLRELGATQAHA